MAVTRSGDESIDRTDFFPEGEAVDVAVVIVSYNSSDDIRQLLPDLRREAGTLRLRVIVADNSSADDTRAMLARHADVITLATGGNLGYAGAINAAMTHVGDTDAILILNPDLRLDPGAIGRMLRRLRSDDQIAAVAPLLRDEDGAVYFSLRRDPTVLRAAADAIIGRFWQRRPAALSEFVRSPRQYGWCHPIDWATGAALLISSPAQEAIGQWDERFFLYSEETDIQRRLRDAGWSVWFDPAAGATHRRGGSGTSADLNALLTVNRVRYIEKHRPRSAAAFRAAVMVGEHLRRSAGNARSRWALRSRARWATLPHARRDAEPVDTFPAASVVIPAHDEAGVISRTLEPLAELAAAGRLEVVVVCNGCHDDTAARARSYAGVQVIETDAASKTTALNLGDECATVWPRFYLDADIVVPPHALVPVIKKGAPAFRPGSVRCLDAGSGVLPRPAADAVDIGRALGRGGVRGEPCGPRPHRSLPPVHGRRSLRRPSVLPGGEGVSPHRAGDRRCASSRRHPATDPVPDAARTGTAGHRHRAVERAGARGQHPRSAVRGGCGDLRRVRPGRTATRTPRRGTWRHRVGTR
ncbi:MAG: glycosyltransferase family 2 protein [Microbacterium sp.]|uniref:glycosyltransferase family 2 protein n=1 Tax=Microbacterium sp. TaxID=51671 RepID=UPI00261F0786|nr:glycosyltransferase family 2 protein [Microbacterium sp.]MCX6502428.1 glycosyltransferase family 2 protein [Microbacterium sp.]